jgi:hypothetical protein
LLDQALPGPAICGLKKGTQLTTVRNRLLADRKALLDLGTRNRLINIPLRTKNIRAIEIVDEKTSEVFRLLGEGKRFTFLPADAESSEDGLTPAQVYKTALAAILSRSREAGASFGEEQDRFLQHLETGEVDLDGVPSAIFFAETVFANTIEGFFSDPAYGGNRDKVGWRMVGFPGVYAAYLGVS